MKLAVLSNKNCAEGTWHVLVSTCPGIYSLVMSGFLQEAISVFHGFIQAGYEPKLEVK